MKLYKKMMVACVATLAISGSAIAFAQETVPLQDYTIAQADEDDAVRSPRAFGGDGMPMEALAEVLGITVEELQAAMQEAREMVRVEREAAREEARAQLETAVAEALGITVEELQTAMAEADNMRDLVNVLDISPEELREAMRTAQQTLREEARAEREAAIAEALGIAVEEWQVAVEASDSPEELAEALGITTEELREAIGPMMRERVRGRGGMGMGQGGPMMPGGLMGNFFGEHGDRDGFGGFFDRDGRGRGFPFGDRDGDTDSDETETEG